MDRFIDLQNKTSKIGEFCLKSNMDRFIVYTVIATSVSLHSFKIQYG